MSKNPKMPLSRAKKLAERFISYIKPSCIKLSIAGSVRRECPFVSDIEVCCVPKDGFVMGKVFPKGYPGMVLNGERLKRFKYPELNLQIELYITSKEDFGRILAIRTGSSAFSHIKLAVTWNRRGLCGTSDGLRFKRECEKKGKIWKIKPEFKNHPTLPPMFDTEEKFFEFLGIPWVDPSQRNWKAQNDKYNYSK